MRAFQQTVQTHTTASSGNNAAGAKRSVEAFQPQKAVDSQESKTPLPVPSFLKALYISSWDTIFDEDYVDPMQTISLGDSNTN